MLIGDRDDISETINISFCELLPSGSSSPMISLYLRLSSPVSTPDSASPMGPSIVCITTLFGGIRIVSSKANARHTTANAHITQIPHSNLRRKPASERALKLLKSCSAARRYSAEDLLIPLAD